MRVTGARVSLIVPVSLAGLLALGHLGNPGGEAFQLSKPYPGMGDKEGLFGCNNLPGFHCAKYHPAEIPTSTDGPEAHEAFVAYVNGYKWYGGGHRTRRKPMDATADPSRWPTHYVEVIDRPRRLRYKDDPNLVKSVMLARITVAPGALEDQTYGLSNPTSTPKFFYLVGASYRPDSNETVNDKLGDRWRISTWSLVEVQGAGAAARVVKVGRSGRVAFCKHTHDPKSKDYGARFDTCKIQRAVQAIRANRLVMNELRAFAESSGIGAPGAESSDDTDWIIATGKRLLDAPKTASATVSDAVRRLVEPLRDADPFTDPVWITCGVGCCIAETA